MLTAFGRAAPLNLEFQLDHIDYSQPNFVHADLDADTLARDAVAVGSGGLAAVGLLAREHPDAARRLVRRRQPRPAALAGRGLPASSPAEHDQDLRISPRRSPGGAGQFFAEYSLADSA